MAKKKQQAQAANDVAPPQQPPAGQRPAQQQSGVRSGVGRVPRSRPVPVDSVQIARPGPDAAPYAGASPRLSVYSEWLNSPPPEVPAWLTGASEPLAAVQPHAASAVAPAPTPTPARTRRPSARRSADAPALDGEPTVAAAASPSRSRARSAASAAPTASAVAPVPQTSGAPPARTRRSTAARRLTAAERRAVESMATGTASPAASGAPARPLASAPAPAPAYTSGAAPAQFGAPSSRPPLDPRRAPAALRPAPAPGTMPHPMPALASLADPASAVPQRASRTAGRGLPSLAAPPPTPVRRTATTPPEPRPAAVARVGASAAPARRAPSPDASSDDWLLDSGAYPLTPRETSPRASAFLTAEPSPAVLSAFAAVVGTAQPTAAAPTPSSASSVAVAARRQGQQSPPATLGQTAGRVAIPRSAASSPRPHATSGRLPAVRPSQPVALAAGATQPPETTILIHGARNPQPTSPVVPRRIKPHSLLAQAFIAVVCVAMLLVGLTITSPLGFGAALSGTFQAYANSVAWIPTPTATPKPPVYVDTGGGNVAPASPAQQVVINEIVAVFGANANSALAVSRCESDYVASARNPYPVGNSHAEGVFQILYPSTWDTTSYAGDNPYDYVANIHAAYQIFQRDGYSWREWQCQP